MPLTPRLSAPGHRLCMHTQPADYMHADRCSACPRTNPHSKATGASHSTPVDPIFHRSPSAGASRWPLLLCNTHARLLWVSAGGPEVQGTPTSLFPALPSSHPCPEHLTLVCHFMGTLPYCDWGLGKQLNSGAHCL